MFHSAIQLAAQHSAVKELMTTKNLSWLEARHKVRSVPELASETDDCLQAVGVPQDPTTLAAVVAVASASAAGVVGGPIIDAIVNVVKWIGDHPELIAAAGKLLAFLAALL